MSYSGKLLVPTGNGYPLNVYFDNSNESGVIPPPPVPEFRITEDDNFRITQDNNFRIVE